MYLRRLNLSVTRGCPYLLANPPFLQESGSWNRQTIVSGFAWERVSPCSDFLCLFSVFPLFILYFPVLFPSVALSTQRGPVDPKQSKVMFS
jgi:hypothetical protein